MELISVIVPCLNEEAAIEIFYNEFFETVEKFSIPVKYEVIFVDDGSTDRTLSVMKSLSRQDKRVHYISFSRNFGKEGAMLAGLRAAKGDFVTMMDVDLQDPPSLIEEMYKILKTGEYDCAAARRGDRKGEGKMRSFLSNRFYSFINKMSDTEFVKGARDFRLMTRRMVNSVLELTEYNRFSKGIFSWVGYRTKWITYENIERSAGETKWGIKGLFKYSIEGIMAFSTKPLAFASFLGILCLLLALLFIAVIIAKTLIWGDPVAGYPSLICVILFIGGLQLFTIGIAGQYIAKTYLEVKKRPIYITKESDLIK
ncbi:MAG: glycosyltransferase family 2 protein [Oscillospiraceae bacterium]|nr:glycosyltransferase family 2 protein [Oscillospiraceae bacterium]